MSGSTVRSMAGDVTYQQEFIASVRDEVWPLLRQDWEEIEHNKDLLPLDPNWDLYELLESQGNFYIFTARDGSKLVGYFTVIVFPSMHSQKALLACNDVIYLDKDYRRGSVGTRLFKFTEKCLKEDGHKVLYITTTEKHPIDPLLERLGYTKIETIFEKVL